jgi:hypothetical protein
MIKREIRKRKGIRSGFENERGKEYEIESDTLQIGQLTLRATALASI